MTVCCHKLSLPQEIRRAADTLSATLVISWILYNPFMNLASSLGAELSLLLMTDVFSRE